MADLTTSDEFSAIHTKLTATFASGKTRDIKWRLWQLKQLYWLLDENSDAFVSSLSKDLHRHAFETLMSDVNEAKAEILEAVQHVEKWSIGQAPVGAGFIFGTICKAWIRKDPRGTVLIIGAWNYPIATLLTVAVAAIAAGNTVVLKPSEMAPHTEQLLSELVPKYLDQTAIALVRAIPKEMPLILEKRFDFIFYTGSARVGRIIAAAAAKHVTPTALELGGQAPGIVTRHANIDMAAKRLINAKLYNLGQVCVCVNHVFVDPDVHDAFIARLVYWAGKMTDRKTLDTLARVVNGNHVERLRNLLDTTKGTVVFTGEHEPAEKMIFPTIVKDVDMSDSLLSGELFGPVLPVVKADLKAALQTINSMPHPLGLYIFSDNQAEVDLIMDSTLSGGVTINDVAIHNDVPGAPFGGVGESGYGNYHGKWGFDTFSHDRTTVKIPGWVDKFLGWRYPPFDMANIGEISHAKPRFRKGESLDDQRIGSFWSTIPILNMIL
ncbi:hypothetical protein E8E14_001826 [Neopestalotiopsis sp. 37M]|nr:hypothetical protein E8E14_001826 [Neopestalotiopsis sp. 37M]